VESGHGLWQIMLMKRLLEFLLAPIPAAMIGGLISWGTGAHPRGLSIAIFYLLQLYALQLIFGLAIYAMLRRTGRHTLAAFASGGLLMTAVVAVPYLAWANTLPDKSAAHSAAVLAIWLALGAITGATGWLLQRPSPRPDQG
jgi:hypothetical protein